MRPLSGTGTSSPPTCLDTLTILRREESGMGQDHLAIQDDGNLVHLSEVRTEQ